ncbi:mandelate racemase/muconate lactonizing enzyme family protein [Paenibacillus sp. GCM10023248]|uniref:mandelate racemase/muconate lactonizing enzyme family protein n=1 Tax=Bacillales TaxID=1385 RepID=UPI0023793BAA|nr:MULTISPECIES: mandelate racemase/muconate lactonizing enzyme family protein [Bacillales]MDD9271882.1 mandelate racemase/muconate lactonizing enzyme family protein [Paenibacillus sp. MAHUQ-63]MDR6885206.1 L-alanine-DL-glutamate epimerase-like enolase superfamily enzyme [Bacillus sp. 3255]
MTDPYESTLDRVNTYSRPSELRITDMRFVDLAGAPMHCTLVKIYTNQGITGIGELRDFGSRTYAAMLKGRLLGENPCNVDKLFRRLKQFMGTGRQAGGVAGIEIALWDLAGKAYGVPVYQMLGGKFRDEVRVYCDLGVNTPGLPGDGYSMGKRLKKFADEQGFTMVKAVLGVESLQDLYPHEELISAPGSEVENYLKASRYNFDFIKNRRHTPYGPEFQQRNRAYDTVNTQSPYTMFRMTERGLDRYEEEVAHMREILGYKMPLAIDHLGYLNFEDAVRLLRRLEKYNLLWAEDMLPCTYTEEYKRLSQLTSTPLATGEDLSTLESFEDLIMNRAVPIIHPDICSSGIYETKKIGDLAQRYHVAMAMHMCETPVAALATAHMGVATENFIATEFNAPDVPWWNDIITGYGGNVIQNGFIRVSDKPGLGFDDINDEVIKDHLMPGFPDMWASTDQWNTEYANDRLFS